MFIFLIANSQDFENNFSKADSLYKVKNYRESSSLIMDLVNEGNYSLDEKNQLYILRYKNEYFLDATNAIKYLHLSKRNANQLSNVSKAELYYYLGNIHRVYKKYPDSVIFYSLRSLYIHENLITPKQVKKIASLSKNLSIAYQKLKDHKNQLLYLRKAKNAYQELGSKRSLIYMLNNIGTYYSGVNNIDSSFFYYKMALNVDYDSKIKGSIYQNIGAIFLGQLNNNDSANYYFDKALNYNISESGLAALYFNKGVISEEKKEYKKAISYYEKSFEYAIASNDLSTQMFAKENISNIYSNIGDYKKALLANKEYILLNDSIKNIEILENAKEIEEKFQNEKLRADNIAIEAEKDKESLEKRIWLIVLGSVILIVITTSTFTLKHSRRKRILALQEKELETQKNLTLLKEQEITTINAMVEGQEKERKRVAEDLHDNLGNVIATLKMHFENLRINKEKKKVDQESLFNKTEGLIDEAYQKVRNMAHAKNAGVIANQGLLVAVKLMAEKVSSANTIQIEVIDYGMERRLENSLEISLFRIVQELTTNIIKHAQASQATINISQDEEDITILIEDNGVGMNTSQIDMQKGMGLHSIKTRVEHLDGSFTIDSTPSKGTTIIIQIPS